MSRKTRSIEERLQALENRKRRIAAEITRLKSRAAKEERRRDTRRKILVGAAVMAYAEKAADSGDEKMMLFIRRLVAGMSERDQDIFEGTLWHPDPEKRPQPEIDSPPRR